MGNLDWDHFVRLANLHRGFWWNELPSIQHHEDEVSAVPPAIGFMGTVVFLTLMV